MTCRTCILTIVADIAVKMIDGPAEALKVVLDNSSNYEARRFAEKAMYNITQAQKYAVCAR